MSSVDEFKKAEENHRREKLQAHAEELKELIRDCKFILQFHEEAGTRDLETEKYLQKLREEQFKISREM